MITVELITKKDLEEFKTELLNEIREILQTDGGTTTKKWLKSADVKHMLKISTASLQNLRISGQLKFTKVGGLLYYKPEDINSLLEAGYIE